MQFLLPIIAEQGALFDRVPNVRGERGLKGAAVAMAKRSFDPLPRAVSGDINYGALRQTPCPREFDNTAMNGGHTYKEKNRWS